MKKLMILFCLFFIFSMAARSQWQQINNGLWGGQVNCFALINSTVFVGTNGGVFSTTNNGANWLDINSGLGNINVNGLAVYSYMSQNYLLAATNDGLYYSTNLGSTWGHITDAEHIVDDIVATSIAVLEDMTGSVVLMGTADGDIFVSSNGISYLKAPTQSFNTVFCFVMTNSPILAGTQNGIFKSSDGGGSWISTTNSLSGHSVRNFATLGNNIYAATDAGIYKTSDNGTTWIETSSAGLTQTNVAALIQVNNNFICGTSGGNGNAAGIFTSTDSGESWTQSNTGLTDPYITTLFVGVSGTNNIVFAGTIGQGVFISTDGGLTWNQSNTGITALVINKFAYYNNYLFAGSASEGMFRSSDFGNTWTQINNGLSQMDISALNISSIISKGNNIYIGTYGSGVFYSTNNGDSWIQTGSEISTQSIGCLAVYNNVIIAGSVQGNGIYKSINDGNIWVDGGSNLTDFNFFSIKVIGSNVYACGSNNLFYATDTNLNWQGTQYSSQYTGSINDILSMNNYLLIGTQQNGLLATVDNGNNWTSLSTAIPNQNITTLALKDSILFTGTSGSGVYYAFAKGLNWKADNTGLTNLNINYLFIQGDSIYAGTYGKGAFRSRISNLLTSVNDDVISMNKDIVIYPNPATKQINLKIEGYGKNETLTLYNLTGKIKTLFDGFLENDSQVIPFDINNLSSGVYFIRQESNGKMFKLIIE